MTSLIHTYTGTVPPRTPSIFERPEVQRAIERSIERQRKQAARRTWRKRYWH